MATSSRPILHTIHNQKFWTEFFLLYESLPALWDMSSMMYKEKTTKLLAYDTMVNKLREIEPSADRDDVVRKINIFRTNYRRECSRINMSILIGKPYKTTLWYFDLLSFLQNQQVKKTKKVNSGESSVLRKKRSIGIKSKAVRKQSSTMKEEIIELPQMIEEDEESLAYDDNAERFVYSGENAQAEMDIEDEDSEPQEYPKQFRTYSLQHFASVKTDSRESDVYDMLTNGDESADTSEIVLDESTQNDWFADQDNADEQTANNPKPKNIFRGVNTVTLNAERSQMNAIKTSEAADILAKSWALQYDEMANDQKIYARKAIADILFEGCLGNLGRNANNSSVTARGSGNGQATTSARLATRAQEVIETEAGSSYIYEDGQQVKINDWIVGQY